MKPSPFYLLMIFICVSIYLTVRAQSDKPLYWKDQPYADTPKVKYQYFYKAIISIPEWGMLVDTLNKHLLPVIGKSMTVDQADFYKSLLVKQFNKLQFTIDSAKIPEPPKPRK